MAKAKKPESNINIVARNRKARFSYEIMDTFEAGMELKGTEVKSMRATSPNIAESYADVKDEEVWLVNSHIPEFSHGNIANHEPRRPRKLLLHRKQIDKLQAAIKKKGYTLVPLMIYFNEKNKAKISLGLGKGKKSHDKRETEKRRDWDRQKQRLLKQ